MKLKVSFWSQFKMLFDLIFISLAFFTFIFLGWNSFDLRLKIFLMSPYFLMFFFPVVILHLNYLKENQGVVFEINKNEIIKKSKDVISKYYTQDVEKIVIYSGGTRNRGYGGLAHSSYYYAKIKFLDGSDFIITSLCSNKIDKILSENFEDVDMKVEREFYPIIN